MNAWEKEQLLNDLDLKIGLLKNYWKITERPVVVDELIGIYTEATQEGISKEEVKLLYKDALYYWENRGDFPAEPDDEPPYPIDLEF